MNNLRIVFSFVIAVCVTAPTRASASTPTPTLVRRATTPSRRARLRARVAHVANTESA
jgi:hypothetical protein